MTENISESESEIVDLWPDGAVPGFMATDETGTPILPPLVAYRCPHCGYHWPFGRFGLNDRHQGCHGGGPVFVRPAQPGEEPEPETEIDREPDEPEIDQDIGQEIDGYDPALAAATNVGDYDPAENSTRAEPFTMDPLAELVAAGWPENLITSTSADQAAVKLGVRSRGYVFIAIEVTATPGTEMATCFRSADDDVPLYDRVSRSLLTALSPDPVLDRSGAIGTGATIFRVRATVDVGPNRTWHVRLDGKEIATIRLLTSGLAAAAGMTSMFTLLNENSKPFVWNKHAMRDGQLWSCFYKSTLAPGYHDLPFIHSATRLSEIRADLEYLLREQGFRVDHELETIAAPTQESDDEIVVTDCSVMALAKLFLETRWSVGDKRTLLRHAGDYYAWQGNAYRLDHDEDVRAGLYRFMEKLRVPETDKVTGAIVYKPFKFKKGDVDQVLDAVRAKANVSAHIEPPAWLDGRQEPPPRDLVPLANGLLHVPARELLPHTPNFFGLNALPFRYDLNAPAPTEWLRFLASIWPDDQQSIDALQEWFGLCLTSDTRHHKVALLVGPPRSGKGTVVRILTALLGQANCCGPTLNSLGYTFGLEPFIGKLLAVISDARLSEKSDRSVITERLLSISGEDSLSVDRKHRDAWQGKLSTRIMICTNEFPRLPDTSGAIASRFLVWRMTESFLGREDYGLTDRLLTELPGILRWSLDGLARLNQRRRFIQPESARQAAQRMADQVSPMLAFIRDHCTVGAGQQVAKAKLFDAWCCYCLIHDLAPGTDRSFGRWLADAMPALDEGRITVNWNRVEVYCGIGLK